MAAATVAESAGWLCAVQQRIRVFRDSRRNLIIYRRRDGSLDQENHTFEPIYLPEAQTEAQIPQDLGHDTSANVHAFCACMNGGEIERSIR